MKVLRLIPRALGVLLLIAAALKADGAAVAPVSATGWFSAAWFQIALIFAEVALGLWLMSGRAPLGAWALALVLFGAFTLFSGYQGLTAQPSCGCFGRVTVSPWYAFGLDIFVLTGLFFGRPSLQPLWDNPRLALNPALIRGAYALLGVFVLAGVFAGTAHLAFGSVLPFSLGNLRVIAA
jgi:hypothetical protein